LPDFTIRCKIVINREAITVFKINFLRKELIEKISRIIEKNEVIRPLPNLTLSRRKAPTEPRSYILPPSICIAVQGAKRLFLGNETYVYNIKHFLLTSIDLPVTAQIIEASEKKPYIGITWQIDMDVLLELIMEHSFSIQTKQVSRGVTLGTVTVQILDAFRRLIELLEEPENIPALLPVIQKEIIYRLLISEQGPRLIQIALVSNHGHYITKAIEYLKKHFAESLSVKELASFVGMSVSSFYQHFKALTGMTPLQYQKKLRLNEARRLILSEALDITNAAFQVGYESPSQFSREYKRLFGISPSQDLKMLREESLTVSAS
jgi:AraC-like DNA-binding protein